MATQSEELEQMLKLRNSERLAHEPRLQLKLSELNKKYPDYAKLSDKLLKKAIGIIAKMTPGAPTLTPKNVIDKVLVLGKQLKKAPEAPSPAPHIKPPKPPGY